MENRHIKNPRHSNKICQISNNECSKVFFSRSILSHCVCCRCSAEIDLCENGKGSSQLPVFLRYHGGKWPSMTTSRRHRIFQRLSKRNRIIKIHFLRVNGAKKTKWRKARETKQGIGEFYGIHYVVACCVKRKQRRSETKSRLKKQQLNVSIMDKRCMVHNKSKKWE